MILLYGRKGRGYTRCRESRHLDCMITVLKVTGIKCREKKQFRKARVLNVAKKKKFKSRGYLMCDCHESFFNFSSFCADFDKNNGEI